MNNIEILAPAGAKEQLLAAVRSGADAVYLGFGSFNARRNAQNFTFEELCEAVKYCHAHNVRVHAALNTLIKQNELEQVYEDIVSVSKAGVDAVIVQDLAVARMVKQFVPELEMHASTQLTAHNLSGVRVLEELGFSRVVLARELSKDEIAYICANAKAEIEVFVHGALCMCMSGGCYLSSILGQRSGNRGLCAQPCRLDFKVNSRSYGLSLKDMSLVEHINELRQMGVASLKIEGRMKRPEYVAAATRACKDAVEGKKPDMETLKAVFSRSGFTDGYFVGARNEKMFGIRQKEDVEAAKNVLKALNSSYKDEVQNVKVNAFCLAKADKPVELTVSSKNHTVTVLGSTPQKAINRSITKEEIIKQLSKTGSTPYKVENIEISLDDGLMLPVSSLNALRREAIEKLTFARLDKKPYEILPYEPLKTKKAKSDLLKGKTLIRVNSVGQLKHIKNREDLAVVLPIKEITEEILAAYSLVLGEIPSLLFGRDDEKTASLLKEKQALGLKYALCDNIGALNLAKEACLQIILSWGMNALNAVSIGAFENFDIIGAVASFESSVQNLVQMKKEFSPLGAIKYGFLPLMRMRACPNKTEKGCGTCTGKTKITDRMNKEFILICNDKRYCTLLNSLPLFVENKDIQTDFSMLYFTVEDAQKVKEIFDIYQNGEAPDFARTGGLYFKNLK